MELNKHVQMDMGNHVDYCMDYLRQKGTINNWQTRASAREPVKESCVVNTKNAKSGNCSRSEMETDRTVVLPSFYISLG